MRWDTYTRTSIRATFFLILKAAQSLSSTSSQLFQSILQLHAEVRNTQHQSSGEGNDAVVS